MPDVYRPAEFYYQSPPPRLIGVEMEYHHQLSPIQRSDISHGLRQQGIACISDFTSNGARVYSDQINLEYATPECIGPKEATAADHAGMIIINNLIQNRISKDKIRGNRALPAMRTTGSYDSSEKVFNSSGYHENYLMPRIENLEREDMLKAVMASFLVTRIVWNGNGLMADKYLLSQKAPGIGEAVLNGYGETRTIHGKKPMAGILEEQDKISRNWSLLEVRLADSHMSRFCTFVSLAATSAALRLTEQGIITIKNADQYSLADPLTDLQKINRNFGRSRLTLKSGKTTTALDLQTRFLENYLKLSEEKDIELPEDEILGVQEALKTCDLLKKLDRKNPDLKPLVRRVEWAAKYYYLRKKLGENLIKHTDEAIGLDRQWHDMNGRIKNAEQWRKFDPMYDQLESDVLAMRSLPPLSRAFARADAIDKNVCKEANWGFVKLNTREEATILSDPYNSDFPIDR